MVIAKRMEPLVTGSSIIRKLFEEGKEMAKKVGAENVYDYSLGNPSVPAPDAVKSSIIKILDTEDPLFVHGYMSNSGYEEVRQAVADNLNERFQWQYKMEDIIMTVGAASGINDILNLFLDSGDEVVVFAPFFGEYRNYVITAGGVLKAVPADTETFQINIDGLDAVITEKTKLIIVNNPNNPTGQTIDRDMLIKILDRCKKQNIVVILDECFLEFLDEPNRYEMSDLRGEYPNLLIIKAFTKIFSMPGLRLGYAISSNQDILEEMSWKLQQWNVSVPAQMAGVAALEKPKEYIRQTREYVSGQREYMRNILKMMGYVVFASKANYLFFKGRPGLEKEALEAGFLIRDCQNYEGLSEGFYRIAVRTKEENERLITWLGRL